MNIFALEIWDDEGARCTFYTVRKGESTETETDKFFNRYYSIEQWKPAVQQLMSFVLDSIGEDHGAIEPLFNRHENEVTGLPNHGRVSLGEIVFLFPNFPLRLYALRVNNRKDIVVLFNGGLKTAQTNQGSRDLHLKWIEACGFARRIDEALRHKEIIIDHKRRELLTDTGDKEIIL
ncbi:MAG: hypothetical protein V4539_16965 [Bacteroidota bacterium]